MTLIEWIAAGSGTAMTIGLAIFKSWKHNNDKVVNLDVRVEKNEKDLKSMSEEWEKRFDRLENETRDISKNNRDDHRILFDKLEKLISTSSRMEGYLIKDSELKARQ